MKRKTKREIRETAERAALLRRVTDIIIGATGGAMTGCDDDGVFGPVELSRIVPAIKAAFVDDEHLYLVSLHNLDEYDGAEKITEFLFRNGVQA